MRIGSENRRVILVNPPSGTLPFALPMGAIDLMNRLDVPKSGVFARDFSPGMLGSASVAVIPVHWFYSVEPALELARKIKTAAPDVKIVTGGYSATLFDEVLAASGLFDAIIRGDAEMPFVAAVRALMEGGPIDGIPNLTYPGGRTSTSYSVSEDDLASADYRDIDWFPALAKAAASSQKCGEVSYLYPWIPVSRGCLFNCDNCLATARAQKKLFGRPPVFRPPLAVREDLEHFSRRRDIRFMHISTDFISMLGENRAAAYLSGGPYDLHCYYEWYRHPSKDALSLLSGSFSRVCSAFFFSMDKECANSGGEPAKGTAQSLGQAVEWAKRQKNMDIMIYVDPGRAAADNAYARAVAGLFRKGGVRLRRIEGDLFPRVGNLDPLGVRLLYDELMAKARAELPGMTRRHRILSPLISRHPKAFGHLLRAGSARLGLEMALRARWNG